jgi:hypothetical protein
MTTGITDAEKETLRQQAIQLDKSLQEVFARLEKLRQQEKEKPDGDDRERPGSERDDPRPSATEQGDHPAGGS